MGSQELRKIRGAGISLIFQEPSLALHPTIRVRDQVREVLAAHENSGAKALREKTDRVLAAVFPEECERIACSYPHQLSGGQRQRVLIAQAIACGPSLVVADEPTASLDVQTEREILYSFQRLRQELGLAMILITHNPSLLLDFADRVLVLYAGRLAELGPASDVLTAPQHPYTQALLRCLPQRAPQAHSSSKTKLPVIPGDGLHATEIALGCTFAPRCPDRMLACETNDPQEIALSNAHNVSCFKFGGLEPQHCEGDPNACSRS
jgi:peptide/nickel transport system ATP-binding protein